MKCIILNQPGGGVRVIHPAYNDRITGFGKGAYANETENAYLVRVAARNRETGQIPPGAAFVIQDVSLLPTRSYRDAWKFDGVSIKHDMVAARQMKIDQELRPERNKRLLAMDAEYMKADEQADLVRKQQIATKKQQLRDMPATVRPSLDAIADPDALKAWQPTWPLP